MGRVKFCILGNYKNILGDVFVGFSFLVLAFLTVKIFAPQINSDATTQTVSQTTGVYTLSMANDDTVTIDITPTSYQAIYTATNNLSVTNNCPVGATITMTTNSTESNDLVRTATDDLNKIIPATSSTSLSSNSWGYSLNGSSYYAVPKKNGTAAVIYNSSAAQVSALTIPVTFGVKTNYSLPAGIYKNDVVYTLTPNPNCFTYSATWDFGGGVAKSGATYPTNLSLSDTVDFTELEPTRSGYIFAGWMSGTTEYTGFEDDANINPNEDSSVTLTAQWVSDIGLHAISNMQQMRPAICEATTTPLKTATAFDWDGSYHGDRNYVPRKLLKDTRDNKYYLVSKLADGNCWMSQSLALDLTKDTPVIISYNDYSTGTATPDNTTQTEAGVRWEQAGDIWRSYHPNEEESYYQDGATKSDSPSDVGDQYAWEAAGNYYNWYAATGGTGTSDLEEGDAEASICPRGWRLPTSEGEKSLYNLFKTAYDLDLLTTAAGTALRSDPLNFNLAGGYNWQAKKMDHQEENGFYWMSTAYDDTDAYRMSSKLTYIKPQGNYHKGYGFPVRCVSI